jgi:peptidoglycan hydrolase FlgJ
VGNNKRYLYEGTKQLGIKNKQKRKRNVQKRKNKSLKLKVMETINESEYYKRVPTILALINTPEIRAQISTDLGATNKVSKQVNFVLNYFDIAIKVGKVFGLHPISILAQASIESGWGTSLLATQNNNFFGITAYGKPNAYWNGAKRKSKTSGLEFRSYKSVEDGFSDFARIISTKYKAAARVSNNIPEYAEKIAYSPYINEKNGDNRVKYKAIIIQSAETILAIAKKKYQSQYN